MEKHNPQDPREDYDYDIGKDTGKVLIITTLLVVLVVPTVAAVFLWKLPKQILLVIAVCVVIARIIKFFSSTPLEEYGVDLTRSDEK